MDGITIYLTGKEREALIDICEVVNGIDDIDERLENGLGSAMYKLLRGCVGEDNYKEYILPKHIREMKEK